MSKNINLLFTGGGTGGHYFPAIAIAWKLKEALTTLYPQGDFQFYFIGSSFGIEAQRHEKDLFYKEFYLPIKGFARSFYKGALLNNIKFPFRFIRSTRTVKKIIKTINPTLVIATGGYVSGIPGRKAAKRNIPLYLQEQNAYPGVTTRLLVKHAHVLFYAYEDVIAHISLHPNLRLIQTPNPVRTSLKIIDQPTAQKAFSLNPTRKTLFILGGSQGSVSINRELLKYAEAWTRDLPLQLLWQTGKNNFDWVKKSLKTTENIHLRPFIDEMGIAYSASDFIICRAGALTLAELEFVKKPAILIPLPSAAANHQYYNTKAFEKRNMAIVITEDQFPQGTLDKTVRHLIENPHILEEIKNNFPKKVLDGAEIIAKTILEDLSL